MCFVDEFATISGAVANGESAAHGADHRAASPISPQPERNVTSSVALGECQTMRTDTVLYPRRVRADHTATWTGPSSVFQRQIAADQRSQQHQRRHLQHRSCVAAALPKTPRLANF